jgi:hypothetical protein
VKVGVVGLGGKKSELINHTALPDVLDARDFSKFF